MNNENPIVAVEFNLTILGKGDMISSKLNVVRVRQNFIKEPVQKDDYYNIKDIFDGVVLNIKHNIRLKCRYDAKGYVTIYITTGIREFSIGSIYSRLGWNKFPISPNEKEIGLLKFVLRRIKDKVKEIKEEFEYSYEDTFYLD